MFLNASKKIIMAFAAVVMLNPTTAFAEDDKHREHLQNRLKELTEEIREAVKSGQQAEVQELMQLQGELIREHAEAINNSHHDFDHSNQEHKELRDRLREMSREVHELRRAGKNEEAERLQHETMELVRQNQKHRPQSQRQTPEGKKIDHLHLAAENLEAAGFHEEAREFHQRAEHLREELERHLREEHDHDDHEHGDHEHHANREHLEHVQAELVDQVQMLSKMMQQMQHQMRQMQEQLNHVRKELSDRRRPPSSTQPPIQYPPTPYQPRRTPDNGFQPPNSKVAPSAKPLRGVPYTPADDGVPSENRGKYFKQQPQPRKNNPDSSDPFQSVPEEKSKKNSSERRQKPTNKREVKVEFKEAKEVVLSMNSMTFMLDLDSGKTMDPPQTYRPEQRSMDIVPMQPQPSQQPVALMGNSLSGFKGDPADWELSTKDLQKKLNAYPLSRLSKLTFDETQAATYLYRTNDGAEGVLQLVELVDSPKGIRVRYRSLN